MRLFFMANRIIGLGKADFDMGDVVYVVGLEYLFGLECWFKLFITFCLGLEIVRESRGGMCLFSGQLIDVIDLEGDG